MRVAFVQFAPRLGALAENRERMAALLPQADGADLVVLPELANSGYHFRDLAQAGATAEVAQGETCEGLMRLCQTHQFAVVCGINERAGTARFNSAIVVDANGLLGVYRKVHLFGHEAEYFEPGDGGFAVFRVGDATIGVLICFDWAFTESWRMQFLLGADIVAHPSNLVLPEKAQRAVPVMAMMHRFAIITANRYGTERDLTFTGKSLIADSDGTVVATAPAVGDSVRVVDVDLDAIREKRITARNDLYADRRPELYGDIAEPYPHT